MSPSRKWGVFFGKGDLSVHGIQGEVRVVERIEGGGGGKASETCRWRASRSLARIGDGRTS